MIKTKKKYETEIKTLSLHFIKEKTIISVAYTHTTHIKTSTPKGNTNAHKDVTNYTLLERVRVPRLLPILATESRSVVDTLSFLDAGDISKYYKQLDRRQAAALKAWRTRRGLESSVKTLKK